MPDQGSDQGWWQTRRRVLGALAGTSIGTVAGCVGGEEDDDGETSDGESSDGDDTGDETGSTDTEDDEITFWLGRDFPDEMQFNFFSPEPGFPEEWGGGLMYGYVLNVVKEEFPDWGVLPLDGVIVEEFDKTAYMEEGELMEFRLRDDVYWHDGEEITPQDMVNALAIHIGERPASNWAEWFDGAEVVDDRTFGIRARQDGWVRDSYLSLQGSWGYYGSSTYREYAEQFLDATSDSEREEITAELASFTDNEGVGMGPYQIGDITETAIILDRFEDYPDEYQSNIERVRLERAEEPRTPVQSGTFDGFGIREGWLINEDNHPPSEREPEYRFDDHDMTGGWSLQFNVSTGPLSNMRVRQALTHLINRNAANLDTLPADADEGLARAMTLATLTGHHDETVENHLDIDVPDNLDGVDFIGDFPTYGANESRAGRAEELLTNEGFTQENGQWYTSDGEPFEPSILTGPTFEPWARAAHGQYQRFGINSTIDQRSPSDFWANAVTEPTEGPIEEYDMVMQNWGYGTPLFAFRSDYHGFRAHGSGRTYASNEGSIDEPEVIVEVPYPIGDPDGSLQEVNVSELIDTVATTADEQEQLEASLELSWISSMLVDRIPMFRMVYHHVICHDEWEWPEKDSRYDLRLAPVSHNNSFVWGDINSK